MAVHFEQYLEESGLSVAFQIIMGEAIAKQISEEQIFAYTALRLRQIGQELDQVDKLKEKEEQDLKQSFVTQSVISNPTLAGLDKSKNGPMVN